MCDSGANDYCPGTCVDGVFGILGTMNAALANHWFAREFFRGLAKKPKVGTLSGRLVNGCTGMRERRGADIASNSEAPTNVFNGRAVGHEQHAVFFESGYSLFECEACPLRQEQLCQHLP